MTELIDMLLTPAAIGSIALISATVIGAILTIRGFRGRRIGTDPHCRKCEYNLTGLTSDNCPECGTTAEGRNVVQGLRVRRWGLLLSGTVVTVIAGAILGLSIYGAARNINWYEYAPDAIVVSASKRNSAQALAELIRRNSDGDLPSTDLVHLIPTALDRQSDEWAGMYWTELLAALDTAGLLERERQERFYDQAVRVELEFRPLVRQGENIQFMHTVKLWGDPRLRGSVRIANARLEIGEQVAWQGRGSEAQLAERWSSIGRGHEVLATLPPGRHRVVYMASKEFLCFGDVDWNEPSFITTVTRTGELEILPVDAPDTVELVDDPTLAEEFKDAITFSLRKRTRFRDEPDSDAVSLVIQYRGDVPMDGAFVVSLLIGDREEEVGTLITRRSHAGSSSESARTVPKPRQDEVLIPILRTSVEAAKDTHNVFRIWDGEIRFDPLTWTEPEGEEP